jgi:hypothetical protein
MSDDDAKIVRMDDLMFDKNKVQVKYNVQCCIDANGGVYSVVQDYKWFCTQRQECPYQGKRETGIPYCNKRMN